MDSVSRGRKPKTKPTDASALLMLLAYVEAECRRIGAIEAASHAALAASAVEQGTTRHPHPTVISGSCH
jgi:hypothetical protein